MVSLGVFALLGPTGFAEEPDLFQSAPGPVEVKPVLRPHSSKTVRKTQPSREPVATSPASPNNIKTKAGLQAPSTAPSSSIAMLRSPPPAVVSPLFQELEPGWYHVECTSAKINAPHQVDCRKGPAREFALSNSQSERCTYERWAVLSRSPSYQGYTIGYASTGSSYCYIGSYGQAPNPVALMKTGRKAKLAILASAEEKNGIHMSRFVSEQKENCVAFVKYGPSQRYGVRYQINGEICSMNSGEVSVADLEFFVGGLIIRL